MTGFDLDRAKKAMAEDGVIHIPGLLSPSQQEDIEDAFAWSLANPGPGATLLGDDPRSRQDLSNPGAYSAYDGMLRRSPIPAVLRELWGGSPVWFMYEQVFLKENTVNRTPWHQDTSYQPVAGHHLGVVWISLDPVAEDETLEFCLGSHKGPLYNGTTFNPQDATEPLYKTGDMPRLPDVEAEREAWRIGRWASNPGDVVLFHPSVLHGGGSPGTGRRRRTLTLRFFGEDAVFESRPGKTAAPRVDGLHDRLRDGDAFRDPMFPLLAQPITARSGRRRP